MPVALLAAVALLSALLSACGGAPASATRPEAWQTGDSRMRTANIAVSGARSMTVNQLRTCSAGGSVLHLIFDATSGSDLYLFEIASEAVERPGDVEVGKAFATTADFSNSKGESWESATSGSRGKVTIDVGLRSGSVDMSLVSPSDGSTVSLIGTWSCG